MRAAGAVMGPAAPAPDRIRSIFQDLYGKMVQLFFDEKRLHAMVNAAMQERWGIIGAHIHDIGTALRHVVMHGQAACVFDRTPQPRISATPC